eukprot:jgi/Tetstr1/433786/TSEL_002412.t1
MDGRQRRNLRQTSGCAEVANLRLLLRWLRQAQFAGYIAAKELGYYREECLNVEIMDGVEVPGGVNITVAEANFGIPWFLEFLESIEAGSEYVHISQVFQRPAWRYFGMPVENQFDMAAVTKTTVRNFGDLRNAVRFGVPLPDLDNGVKSLLLKYNKRFCGANNWRTAEFIACTGSEDIQFVTYGFNITNIPKMELPFFQGMSYNELAENRNIVLRFITASYKGWIHCRDNELACVNLIAPNYGNTLQQNEHTLQTWQMREVNRGMWPAQLGIGVHNLTEMLEAAMLGREIGALAMAERDANAVTRTVISEMFTLEAHDILEAQGIDIYGAEWVNKSGLRFCTSDGIVAQCSEDTSTGLETWKLAVIIAIPALLIIAFLVILACHTCTLRQRLRELQADPVVRTLDLEAPIMKVRRLLRTVNDLEGDRVTPELAMEVRNMMDALQKAHDMNMPDLEQQLLKIDKTLYSSGLSLYLMQNLMQGEVKTSNSGITPMVSRDGSLTVSFTEASRKLLCIHAETASEQGDELPKGMDGIYNFNLTVHPEADELLHKIGVDPCLDMLALSSLGTSQLLITVTFHIFRAVHDLILPLGLNDRKLMNFMQAMETGMKGPKFHNLGHAADTMSRLSAIVKMGGLYDLANLAMKRELTAALIACIVEDYQHPGRTNVFHVKRQSDAALMFNQQHVNQNNSIRECMATLRDPECNFIEAWSEEEQHEFRCNVIQLVLGSDLDMHFELLTRFQMRWVKLKDEEHFEQGDEERQLGLPVSGLSDRSQPGLSDPKTQIGWFDIIVIPTFQQFCNVFVDCEVLLMKCLENRRLWEEEVNALDLDRLEGDRAPRHRASFTAIGGTLVALDSPGGAVRSWTPASYVFAGPVNFLIALRRALSPCPVGASTSHSA